MTSADVDSPSNRSGCGYDGGSPNDVPRRKVGLSDAAVATDGSALVTSGLGSCLGVAVHHPSAGAGGLLHAMLPEASDHPGVDQKFVVQGVEALLAALADEGAPPDGLRAKLAGASEMIEFDRGPSAPSVGRRNVEAAERVLAANDVPVVAADTGGHRGRSLRFDTADGRLRVAYAGGDTRVL
ncbi:chemotaxis protein CheD [Halorarum salinum]|uniref:Probable chemoreceptor glutamine deamidase CheD n=1 Tax=Halorarum salinum TaxID=2743089 RepID=A0A7D5QAJ0_9EURY|nr:chemotaxis protein CheD [Halobaculum salinum]QLG61020.1 chemotaxis protein CheD [Halobaculum salinum]